MQEQIQAHAERIAGRFGIAPVEVTRRRDLVTLEARTAYMLHEMAHKIQEQKVKGGSAHGQTWKRIARKIGAAPEARQDCPLQRRKIRQVVAQVMENPRTREQWMQYIAQKGLQKLGAGASRDTYALSADKVIKIERLPGHDRLGQQCNSERARWAKADEKTREYLAVIFDGGDGWVVMERARMTLDRFGGDSRTVSGDMVQATGIGDLHAQNIGYFTGGRFKIIDYAL